MYGRWILPEVSEENYTMRFLNHCFHATEGGANILLKDPGSGRALRMSDSANPMAFPCYCLLRIHANPIYSL